MLYGGVDFWRPILLALCTPSVAGRTITCWCLPLPDLQPPPLLSSPLVWLLALRPPHRPRRSGGTCSLYGIWLAGCMQERITEAKQIQHCYYNRWGKRGIQYLDRCHLLIPPVWKLDIVQNECLSNDVGDKGHIYEARQSSVFAEQAQYNCRP